MVFIASQQFAAESSSSYLGNQGLCVPLCTYQYFLQLTFYMYEYFLYYFVSYLCCQYGILLNIFLYDHSVKLDRGFAPHFIELAADVFHQVCKKDKLWLYFG